ncbi:MAG: hypothetical protein WCD89_01665 [Anaerocolumna sp.]
MRQLSKNKVAMLGLIILITECLLALLSTYISPYGYADIGLDVLLCSSIIKAFIWM